MASAGLPAPPGEVIAEQLTCRVCRRVYRDPVRLPCAHVFCLACLEGRRSRGAAGRCPECGARYEAPPGGLPRLPEEDLLRRLSETLTPNEVGTPKVTAAQHPPGRYDVTHDVTPPGTGTPGPEALRDGLRALLSNQRHHLVELSRGAENIRRYERDLRAVRRCALDDVRARADTIRAAVAAAEERLVSEVETYFRSEQSRAALQFRHTDDALAELDFMCTLTDRVTFLPEVMQLGAWVDALTTETARQVVSHSRGEERYLVANPLNMTHSVRAHDDLQTVISGLLGHVETGRGSNATKKNSCEIAETPSSQYRFGTKTDSKISRQYDHYEDEKNTEVPSDQLEEAGNAGGSGDEDAGDNVEPDDDDLGDDDDDFTLFSVLSARSRKVPCVTGVVCLSNGDLVVADCGNACVRYYTGSNLYRTVHVTPALRGMCPLDGDSIAVCDGPVQILDSSGRIQRVLRQQPRDCHGVALSSSGDLAVTDLTTRSVQIFELSTGCLKTIISQYGGTEFVCPSYVAFNDDDDIIITDATLNMVYLLTQEGEVINCASSARGVELNAPCGVCADRDGGILLCDKYNDRVIRFDRNLTYCKQYYCGGFLHRPQCVTTNNSGKLVICGEEGVVCIMSNNDLDETTAESI